MTLYEGRDAEGRVRKRVRSATAIDLDTLSARFGPGLEWLQVEAFGVRAPRLTRAPRLLERTGSAAALAKRARLRARLDAGGQPFVRRLVESLIESGALDHFRED